MALPASASTGSPVGGLPIVWQDQETASSRAWLEQPTACVAAGTCDIGTLKWLALTLSHAGVDADSWPEPERSLKSALAARGADIDGGSSNRAQSLAMAILAAVAVGLDPYAFEASQGPRDLVAELLAEFKGAQFGSPQMTNDDIFSLLALNAARYEGREVDAAITTLEATQSSSGGVGWSPAAAPDVDMTSVAIMALAPHERQEFVTKALGFLRSAQIGQGASAGCWGYQASAAMNAESTAWALQALVAAGEDPLAWSRGGQAINECLLRLRNADGGFAHAAGSKSNLMATMQAVAALGWVPFGHLRGGFPLTTQAIVAPLGADLSLQDESSWFRDGTQLVERLDVHTSSRGQAQWRGVRLAEPFGLHMVVVTVPPLPARPVLVGPGSMTPGESAEIRIDAASPEATWWWKAPGQPPVEGTSLRLGAPAPGAFEVLAWGVNAAGEAGPIARHRIDVSGEMAAEPGEDLPGGGITDGGGGSARVRTLDGEPAPGPALVFVLMTLLLAAFAFARAPLRKP
jgi:hypothetical protein